LTEVPQELPSLTPALARNIDSGEVLKALGQIEGVYQAPVALFYLEDCSYKEIADILGIPIGTVKSRLARGIARLQRILASGSTPRQTK
jgi:RNA polymerase sigma-70 factor (ECF subfamily)